METQPYCTKITVPYAWTREHRIYYFLELFFSSLYPLHQKNIHASVIAGVGFFAPCCTNQNADGSDRL